MNVFAGIDGGGTRTRAFLCDTSGAQAAWGESGVTNPNHARPEEIRRHLASALQEACARHGVAPSDVVSAFLGVAGITDEVGRNQMRHLATESGLSHARLAVDHDIRIALAGGLEGRPGIALIVGTGSSCYGRTADGQTWQTGGWESLLGDEGSGYFLGREAMIAAVRMADGRTEATPLEARVFAWLGVSEVSQILTRLRPPGLSKREIAELAPRVVQWAEAGDLAARRILERGAGLLAEMVAANHHRLPTGPDPEVVVTGGLGTADELYRRLIYTAIKRELPTACVTPPSLAPAVGAALLALEQAGIAVSPSLLTNLRQHSR